MQREDFSTAAWKRMKRHLESRVAELRADNDSRALTEAQTAAIRGRIAELKDLLALEKSGAGDDARPGEDWLTHPAGQLADQDDEQP